MATVPGKVRGGGGCGVVGGGVADSGDVGVSGHHARTACGLRLLHRVILGPTEPAATFEILK